MKNWKTTLFGLLFALSSAVTSGTIQVDNLALLKTLQYVQVAAAAALGMSSKDKDVTGVGAKATRIKTPKND